MLPLRENTPQRLLSIIGGVVLATGLIFIVQVLSAIQTSSPDNNPMLILNLLDLPQTQITVKKEKKRIKKPIKKIVPKKEKPNPEKTIKPEAIIKNTTPDLSNISKQAITNTQSEPSSLPPPVPFYKLSDLPRFTHRETPVYPENMRASGNKGTVELMVLIDKTGKVRKITILKSAGDSFDQAAINAIKASTFMPAKVEGKPVTALLKMPVKFKLL